MTDSPWVQRLNGSASLKNGSRQQGYQFTAEDNALLDKVQRQTLRYFTEFAHPLSGMARDRSNGDNDVVVTGGTGFGIMAMIAGEKRGWLTRRQLYENVSKIVRFLKAAQEKFKAEGRDYHGVFPHYLNGTTGQVFIHCPDNEVEKTKAESGDIVETSFLMMGLLAAREYFNAKLSNPTQDEMELCRDITELYEKVEWDRHARDNVLYWKRHPDSGELGYPIKGWNECLVTHVLAAGSPTYAVSPEVYNHWITGFPIHNTHYGDKHGPLFFAHYSFLGLDPNLVDGQENHFLDRNSRHVLANWEHCTAKYGEDWGLTACDRHDGYGECYPSGVDDHIAPTGPISSIVYEPEKAMRAIRRFMTLRDKADNPVWREGEDGFGFADSFRIGEVNSDVVSWCAPSYIAIDQGPIVGMIENARSGLLWELCMGCKEIAKGLQQLKISAPPPLVTETLRSA